MGLTLLSPLFLLGTLAVAVPILIHLTHRERKEAIPFPSLMFLRRVPYRTVRRQRIRHWLLLLLRTAAVLLLVSAFARPFVDRASLGPAVVGEGREIVLLLDQSASMAYENRWERATAAARERIDGLGPDDRATVVLFSDRAEAMSQPTADGAVLRGILDEASVRATPTRYAPALQLAHDLLDASGLPNRELVLLTDFQRAGWAADAALRMPEGTVITTVDLSDDAARNLAITGVRLDRPSQGGANRLIVSARVVNASSDSARNVPVRLEVGDEVVETRRLSVGGGTAVTVAFAPVPLPNREVRAQVRLERDALASDDVFRFTVAPPEVVPALVVRHPSGTAAELLYLREALQIGADPRYAVETMRVNELGVEQFSDRALVILFDAPFPRGPAGRGLRDFVRAGGGLLVILGPRAGGGPWPPEADGILGESPGAVVDRAGLRGGTLSVLDYQHPVFSLFASTRGVDFSGARFFRYRRWSPPDSATVLARFDDGAPALTEVPAGGGRVLVWSAGTDNLWSDLPVQPVFLPFVHELARYLVAYRSVPGWRTAGTVLDLAGDLATRNWGPTRSVFGTDPGELIVETPSGERFAATGPAGYRLALLESGFYRIRQADGAAAVTVAVNQDPAESDLTPIDREEVLGAIAPTAGGSDRVAALSATLSTAEKERRQALWWYVLLTALMVLVTETVIAGRLSGAGFRRVPSGGS